MTGWLSWAALVVGAAQPTATASDLAVPAKPYHRVVVYHLEAPELSERHRGMLTAALVEAVRGLPGYGALSAGRARHQPTLGDPAGRFECLKSDPCLRRAMRLIGAQSMLFGAIEPAPEHTETGPKTWTVRLTHMTEAGVRREADERVESVPGAPPDPLLDAARALVTELLGVEPPTGPPTMAVAADDELPAVPIVPVEALDDRTWLLPPWVFGVTAGLAVATAGAAVVVAAEMSSTESRFNQLTASRQVVSGRELRELAGKVYDLADAANALLWTAGGLLTTTLVLAFFTDFAPAPAGLVVTGPDPATGGAGAAVTGRW